MDTENVEFVSPFPPKESSVAPISEEPAFVDPDDDEDCRAGLEELDWFDDDE